MQNTSGAQLLMIDLVPKHLDAKKNDQRWYLTILNHFELLRAISEGATYSDIAAARSITKPRVAQMLGYGFRAVQKYDPSKRFGSDWASSTDWQRFLRENNEDISQAINRSVNAIVTPLQSPLTVQSSVDALNISSRARNYLRGQSLTNIGVLISLSKSELAQIMKIPRGSLSEVIAEVEARGLAFRPDEQDA
jgi:hypothetical protein